MDERSDPITSALDPGERLLWSGKPRGGIRLRMSDALFIPFSLLWGGFAIFWEFMALTMTASAPTPIAFIFPIFGIPFVVAGLYMIVGRFFVDARQRANTSYALTNERVLIASGLFTRQTKSVSLRTLPELTLDERSDGSGTITFGASDPLAAMMTSGWRFDGRRTAAPSFEMIDDVRAVHERIRKAQRESQAT